MEVLKDIKAVLIDWDDTHVSSYKAVVELFNQFAEAHGLPKPGLDKISANWGQHIPKLIPSLWPDADPKEINEKYASFIPIDWDTPPFPGVEETVSDLVENGLKVGIVSSNSSIRIRQIIARHMSGIENSYCLIHGEEECSVHKPDPHVFDPAFMVLKKIGINESETLYVGDGISDYIAAKRRGMPFVAVTTGSSKPDEFLTQGLNRSLIIDNFTKLSGLLKD